MNEITKDKNEQQAPQMWKDGDTAKLVNELKNVAVNFCGTEQLRERIAQIVRPLADRIAASPAGPVSGFKVDMSLVEKWQRENNVVQEPGSREAAMVIIRHDENGRPTVWCDPEIADLVAALNTESLSTVASCSGHGYRPGLIILKDGRRLMVFDNEADYERAEGVFPLDIEGKKPAAEQATIAGLESSVGHLSRLVDEQLSMLIQVEKELCVDGHFGAFEDGESQLCDRIRAHIAAHGIVQGEAK